MSLAELSRLSLVVAAVGYLIALGLHSVEWAAARGLAASRPADGSEDSARIRVDLFGRLGVAATAVSAVVHLVAVVSRGVAAERPPWGNAYEFIATALIIAVVTYLVMLRWFQARWLGLGVALVATVGLGLAETVFYVDVAPLVPALHSAWFLGHVAAAVISGAAFNVAGVAAAAYLIKQRYEASGRIGGYLARVPAAERLDLISYRFIAFAFPLWTLTIIAGAIWAQYAWGRFWGWDPKEVWSFITWVIFAAYLHARATAGWRGRRAAYIALLGVGAFWFNMVGVNLFFGGLHAYSGV